MKDRQSDRAMTVRTDDRVGSRLLAACRGPRALSVFAVLSVLESSFLPLPIDLAMAPLGLAQPRKIPFIVLIGALGSTLGAIISYLIGAFFMATLGQWLFSVYGYGDEISGFMDLYEAQGWAALVMAGITPIPFTMAAMGSGAAGMNFGIFILATFAIRLVRFTIMGILIGILGTRMMTMMQRHSKGLGAAAVLATVIGFFLLPLLLDAW